MTRVAQAAVLSGVMVAISLSWGCDEQAEELPFGPSPAPRVEPMPHPAITLGQDRPSSLTDVAKKAVRSVVNVSSERTVAPRGPMFHDPFFRFFEGPIPEQRTPRARRERSLGSGVLVAEGIVVTNDHVVARAEDVRVAFQNGRDYEAEVVGRDPLSDVAVLRVKGDTSEHPPMRIGDSTQMQLGDVVLAVGNPFAVGHSVTMGIISAVGRAEVGIADYEDFIQTDAAINPGNSGGALVNMKAELVGINTAILSRTGGYQGIGFAIPSAMVKPIVHSLLEHGKVVRGWLGASIQDLSDDLAEAMRVPKDSGVLVADVTARSPAAEAGLQRGDVIVSFNGTAVNSAGRLRNLIAASAEDEATLEVIRGGERKTIEVALGTLPEAQQMPAPEPKAPATEELGGLRLRDLDDTIRRQHGIEPGLGVLVVGVLPDSPAARAGLRPGDVILQVGTQRVGSAAELRAKFEAGGEHLALLVRRGRDRAIFVPFDKSPD